MESSKSAFYGGGTTHHFKKDTAVSAREQVVKGLLRVDTCSRRGRGEQRCLSNTNAELCLRRYGSGAREPRIPVYTVRSIYGDMRARGVSPSKPHSQLCADPSFFCAPPRKFSYRNLGCWVASYVVTGALHEGSPVQKDCPRAVALILSHYGALRLEKERKGSASRFVGTSVVLRTLSKILS